MALKRFYLVRPLKKRKAPAKPLKAPGERLPKGKPPAGK